MKSEKNKVFEWLKNISSDWKGFSEDFVNKEICFFDSLTSLLGNIRKENEANNKFNIFSKISEIYCPDKAVYEKENPNSEILKLLLNPNTEEIGDEEVLKSFFKLIDMSNYSEFFPDFKNIQILREKHRMDIYIRNEENAVIIESKLNGAPHQDFQLARYYLEATNRDKLTVQKIVYLTLNPIGKLNLGKLYKPSPSKKYTTEEQNEYYNTVSKIQPLITYISAVDGDKSLSKFFKDCSEKSGINRILKILLEEYSELLVKLAGEERMTDAELQLIQKIYDSQDGVRMALQFQEVWKQKDKALRNIFEKKFQKAGWKYDSNEQVHFKIIKGYALYICFQEVEKNYPIKLQIGFWKEKSKKWEEEELKNLLVDLIDEHGELGVTSEKPYVDSEWGCIDFFYNAEDNVKPKKITSYFSEFMEVVNSFESKVTNLKQ